jgi:hypothetical protein
MKKFYTNSKYILIAILIVAFGLRIFGLNWDQNQHLNPDERFLTMVTQQVDWPSLGNYFHPLKSTLNPYNNGFNFFVYGTLPLKIGKLASAISPTTGYLYNNITLIGRLISALLDVGIVYLIFLISKSIFGGKRALIASSLYSLYVLPIQLSHFYSVDTFLVFFITLSSLFLIKFLLDHQKLIYMLLLGITFGLAIASKISALVFAPIIITSIIFDALKNKEIRAALLNIIILFTVAYLSFRVADPRAFSSANFLNPKLNPIFIQNLSQLRSFVQPDTTFPPSVQWLSTDSIIYSVSNIALWGLGLPLFMLALMAIINSTIVLIQKYHKKIFRPIEFLVSLEVKDYVHFLMLFWILLLFIYQGLQFAKPMRYLYPIYPFIAIISANSLLNAINKLKKTIRNKKLLILINTILGILLILWPVAFTQIYTRPHSRVSASKWMFENIPAGSTLSCEHWDDCLPLSLNGFSNRLYKIETLEMYNPDDVEKWDKINTQLQEIDYLILSSNRLWGSIPKVPERYPIASQFYSDLFSGRTNFKQVAEFHSYPTIPFVNIEIPDASADESFTVYDHPQVLIYKRVN